MTYMDPTLKNLSRLGAVTQKWMDSPGTPPSYREIVDLHATLNEIHNSLSGQAQTLNYLAGEIMSIHDRIVPAKEEN